MNNIVLLEPQIPQNTGNIVRTCAATNSNLHIIKPMGFRILDKYVKRAGLDYWDKASIHFYDNIDHFFLNNKGVYYFFTTKADVCYSDVRYVDDNIFLFFGREDAGIPESLLKQYHKNCVRIPMFDDIRSLNLSNSVAIAIYEVLRQQNFNILNIKGNLQYMK